MATERLKRAIGRHRSWLVIGVLAATLALTPPVPERWGDRLQYALPLLGLSCSVLTGGSVEYLARFAVAQATVDGSKWLLGEAAINQRPNGHSSGFPSGHTMAAAFGASALAHDCVAHSPVARVTVVIAAGFTGASRMDAGKHDIWQVLAGWIVGVGIERAFRRRVRRWRETRRARRD